MLEEWEMVIKMMEMMKEKICSEKEWKGE